MVCELCEARAANEGWIREGGDNALPVRRNGGRGGRSVLDRLRLRRDARPAATPELETPRRTRVERLREGGRADADPVIEGPPRPRDAGQPPAQVEGDRSRKPTERRDPAGAPRHVHAVPTNADLKMERALEVFNTSPHPRRVAGVARSLGNPAVAVLASETEGSIVSVVVAWELCWYRYEIDLADEASGVRVIAQGAELSELDAGEREPNAAADERGLLVLAS